MTFPPSQEDLRWVEAFWVDRCNSSVSLVGYGEGCRVVLRLEINDCEMLSGGPCVS